MPDFKTTLVGIDSPYKGVVDVSIPRNYWLTLLSYKSEADHLRSTRFVQNERGGQISFHFSIGNPLMSKANKVDMEEVSAMLHRLRPFVLESETTFFHKTKKVLKRFLDHDCFRNYLDELSDGFNLKTMRKNLSFLGATNGLISRDMVMNWLNSFEYHRDQDKKTAVEEALGIFGKDQNGTPFILFSLVDMINGILALSDLIETLMMIEKGELSEIKCPERHLQKL